MRGIDLNPLDLNKVATEKTAQSNNSSENSLRSSSQGASIAISINVDAKHNAYKIFNTAFYAQSELSHTLTKETSYDTEVSSPANVASVILGAVEDRLKSEKQSGASQERLASLMEQARYGIEKGFGQAREDIKSLGLMTEELDDEISQSYSLVQNGLERIDKDYVQVQPLQQKNTDNGPNLAAVSSSDTSPDFSSPKQVLANVGGINRVEERYARSESFTFELTTQDGDIVEIDLQSVMASGLDREEGSSQFYLSGDVSYSLSVKGELDSDEMNAINDLIGQVSGVADLFFTDDFQGAFQSALNVGFDSSEIASFALDLRKVVYEEVRSYGGPSHTKFDPATIERYQPLAFMVSEIDAFASLEKLFAEPAKAVSEFVAKVLEKVSSIEASSDQSVGQKNLSNVESETSLVDYSLLKNFEDFVFNVMSAFADERASA